MTSLPDLIQSADPDIEFIFIKSLEHKVRGIEFGLQVCRVEPSGQYRIYVACRGQILAHVFDPDHDSLSEPNSPSGLAIVDDLINSAINDIDENHHDLYTPV